METTDKLEQIKGNAFDISQELYSLSSLLRTVLAALPDCGDQVFIDALETIRIAAKHLDSQAERVEMITN